MTLPIYVYIFGLLVLLFVAYAAIAFIIWKYYPIQISTEHTLSYWEIFTDLYNILPLMILL